MSDKTTYTAPGAESGLHQHLDTNRHTWRVFYKLHACNGVPIFTNTAFSNAPLAAATAIDITNSKRTGFIQHPTLGIVDYSMLPFVALLPSQHWDNDKIIHEHPRYREWLNWQQHATAAAATAATAKSQQAVA